MRYCVIVLVGCASYAGGIVQGLTTFGDAIVFHMIWHAAVLLVPGVTGASPLGTRHLELVTLLMSLRASFVSPVLVWQVRKSIASTLMVWVLPGQVITILVGSVVLKRYAESPTLRVILGIFFIIFGFGVLGVKLWSNFQRSRRSLHAVVDKRDVEASRFSEQQQPSADSVTIPEDMAVVSPSWKDSPATTASQLEFEDPWAAVTPTCKGCFLVAALFSGFLSGSSGIGGPPFFLAIIAFDLPPTVVRGTLPLCFTIVYAIRNVWTFADGDFRLECWPEYVAMVNGGIAGVIFGNVWGSKLSRSTFVSFTFVLLLEASLTMLDSPLLVNLVIGVACLVFLLGFAVPRGIM